MQEPHCRERGLQPHTRRNPDDSQNFIEGMYNQCKRKGRDGENGHRLIVTQKALNKFKKKGYIKIIKITVYNEELS